MGGGLRMCSAPVIAATITSGEFLFPMAFWMTTQGRFLRISRPIVGSSPTATTIPRTTLPGIRGFHCPSVRILRRFADLTHRVRDTHPQVLLQVRFSLAVLDKTRRHTESVCCDR